ncbi:MAG: respiratory nitrate reductase subunit gamma [Candidatus Methanospirareceae archaeon]
MKEGLEMVSDLYYTIFWIFHAIALIIFAIGLYINVSIWMKGQLEGVGASGLRKFAHFLKTFFKITFSKHFFALLKMLIIDAILQRKIFKQSKVRWAMHTLIAVGFIGLLCVATIHAMAHHFYQSEFVKIYIGGLLSDFFGLLLLLGIIVAMVRRFIVRSEQLETNVDDAVAVLFLAAIVISGFLTEIARFVGMGGYEVEMGYSFVGYPLSLLFSSSLAAYHDYLWLFHSLISTAFIAYIPFSKFFHIIVSPITIVLSTYEEKYVEGYGKVI